MGIFHEFLPGNLVFFKFSFIHTKKLKYLDHTIKFYVKNYIICPNFSSGGEILPNTIPDQPVTTLLFESKRNFCLQQ